MAKREGPSRKGFHRMALAHLDTQGGGVLPRAERPRPQKPTGKARIWYGCDAQTYVDAGIAANLQHADALAFVLEEEARAIAAGDGSDVRAAFVKIIRALLSIPGLENERVQFYLIGELARRGEKFGDHASAIEFIRYIHDALRDTWTTATRESRLSEFRRRFYCAYESVMRHRDCEPIPENVSLKTPTSLFVRALTLWSEVNHLVPPCKYLRLERLLLDRGIPHDAAHAVLRKHGADMLDDLVQLLIDRAVDESGLWELAAQDTLPHDAGMARYPTPPECKGNKLAAALTYAFPGWKTLENFLIERGGLYEETHSFRPGWYKPSPPDANDLAVREGLRTRLKLEGKELDARVARARLLFGAKTPAPVLLFAVDLFSYWRATAPHELCLRAARVSKQIRLTDEMALALFAHFGPESVPALLDEIERERVGFRECTRFLRYPKAVLAWRTNLPAFIDAYRAAGSPANLARLPLSPPTD